MSSPDLVAQLKSAIDHEDIQQVQLLMTQDPLLHSAPLGYGGDGPLAWVAECRIPRRLPSWARLEIARWMIENGSDVHQGGDGPLGRAALDGERIPMMELLVASGADVNALWHGSFPIIHSPCETVDPEALEWLLAHGADPNRHGSALDYLIGSYVRAPERLAACLELLLAHGAASQYDHPPILAILRNRPDLLEAALVRDPTLVDRRFDDLAFGNTGGRMLTLRGGTLLHVAAEFGNVAAARILRQYGADVDAEATVDEHGIGGQTSVFHSATQADDFGLSMTKWLRDEGADLSLRRTVPGHYERPGEVVHVTPLEYARLFPGGSSETVKSLETPPPSPERAR